MNPYASDKLSEYPDVIRSLRTTGEGKLLTVHLMPQNVCNHSCSFCSYRMPENKNSESFDEGKFIQWTKMEELLQDFAEMGVQGIELTGGGEPLAYPHLNPLLFRLRSHGFAVGLVTNGTLYDKISHIEDLGSCLRWVRVSIDSSKATTYAAMRKTNPTHFEKAWDMVRDLHSRRDKFHPEFRLGVGFVLCNDNMGEIPEFVELARASGADNVRLSLCFADSHLDYFTDRAALNRSVVESTLTEGYRSSSFKVHNMIPRRYSEQDKPFQDYKRCPTKDVLCVVEGEGKVYTCCTFTGSTKGLYGNFMTHEGGFRGLWDENSELRRNWDTRKECAVACLYRDRNIAMNKLIDDPDVILHKEFI